MLLDLPGDPFWEDVDLFVKNSLLPRKLVSESDLALYHVASGVQDAVDTINNFYSNYHSTRIVGNLTVIRLRDEITDARLMELNQQFAYLSNAGTITKIKPTAAEVSDKDNLELFSGLCLCLVNFLVLLSKTFNPSFVANQVVFSSTETISLIQLEEIDFESLKLYLY